MPYDADSLLDRIKLKRSVIVWRTVGVLAVAVAFLVLSVNAGGGGLNITTDHIARIAVEGIIFEDADRDAMLSRLENDKHAKAVLVYINSPGGTVVGGENLYNSLRKISQIKPVVAVMGSVAASGGYMAAIGADRIFAGAGTITGSVGVVMQSFDITELGNKLGVDFITLKSGKLKATPSPFEKLTTDAKAALDITIQDSFKFFLDMVVERRALSEADISRITDGQIFTGRQALKFKLVDEIGGQENAVKWLQEHRKIDKNIKVINVELDSKKKFVEKLVSKITGGIMPIATVKNPGLLALWGG